MNKRMITGMVLSYAIFLCTAFVFIFWGNPLESVTTVNAQEEIKQEEIKQDINTEGQQFSNKEALLERKKEEVPQEMLEIPGFGDLSLTSKQGIILYNPKSNSVSLCFSVKEEDSSETIFESEEMSSGEELVWIPGEVFSEGIHNVCIEVYSSSATNDSKSLRASNHITIEIVSASK